jgi:hypothetical protein
MIRFLHLTGMLLIQASKFIKIGGLVVAVVVTHKRIKG